MLLKNRFTLFFLFAALSMVSCKKFLETKSNQTLSTPSTLTDLELLLDNPGMTNNLGLAYGGTDEYYVSHTDLLTRSENLQKAYKWDPTLNDYADWDIPYRNAYYANNVLNNLDIVDAAGEAGKKKRIKGTALFARAHAFYHLAQFFAPQYDAATATTDLGIPLRLSANFNLPSERATVQQTYDQVIGDIQQALELIPDNLPQNKIRPGKWACHAMLARIYLQIGNYEKAKEHAEAALDIYDTLLDFNSLVPVSNYWPMPFLENNTEILFHSKTESPLNLNYFRAKADSGLYRSYPDDDLRKLVFYASNGNGTYAYVGNYTGEAFVGFSGLATDEVFLVSAEANARLGNTNAALEKLNALLIKRWKTGSFIPYTAPGADQALSLILEERKKELVNRGTRWSDMRRLNKESRFAITLKRNLNGQIIELPPNDLRYTLLIPKEVIRLANLPQNPR